MIGGTEPETDFFFVPFLADVGMSLWSPFHTSMLQALPSALPAPPTRTRLATRRGQPYARAPNLSHTPKHLVSYGQRSKMASGDPALDEIRARRLAELQAQYGGGVRV